MKIIRFGKYEKQSGRFEMLSYHIVSIICAVVSIFTFAKYKSTLRIEILINGVKLFPLLFGKEKNFSKSSFSFRGATKISVFKTRLSIVIPEFGALFDALIFLITFSIFTSDARAHFLFSSNLVEWLEGEGQ